MEIIQQIQIQQGITQQIIILQIILIQQIIQLIIQRHQMQDNGKETENGKINYKRNYNYIIDMLGYNFSIRNTII